MPRMIDADCKICGFSYRDHFVMNSSEEITHETSSGEVHSMEYLYRPNANKAAQWSDRDSIVVYRTVDGQIRYPGRNDQATPQGCERVTMKSLREVEAFERKHNVRNEAIHYDSGSGTLRPDEQPTRHQSSEADRYKKFLKAMQ